MVSSKQIIWSLQAQSDLKTIYRFCKKQDEQYADRVIEQIIKSPENIIYEKQYQIDEFLELPYRRLFVKHWRIVYKSKSNIITVLRVFDTRQNPFKLK